MPSKSPTISKKLKTILRQLGQQIRNQRKKLGISAIATAESAGMSRVTLYRIEQGEASVALGAYLGVLDALGLSLELVDGKSRGDVRKTVKEVPKKIRIADYAQLKRLAWQLRDTKELAPREALSLYERNWRHLNFQKMDSSEKEFLELLLTLFGKERPLV